jgi:hypothetical protein
LFRFRSGSRWATFMLTSLVLAFHADAQQAPQTPPPNPYLMGTEGFYKGPRGLTSYMPVAITESLSRSYGKAFDWQQPVILRTERRAAQDVDRR